MMWFCFCHLDAESYAAMATSGGGSLSIQQTKSVCISAVILPVLKS